MTETDILTNAIIGIQSDIGDIKESVGNINGTLTEHSKATDQRFTDVHGRIKKVEQQTEDNEKRLDKTEKFNIGIQNKMDVHESDKESHYQSNYANRPMDRLKRHKTEITVTGGIIGFIWTCIEFVIPWILRTYGG